MRLDAAVAGGGHGGEQGDTHHQGGEQAEQTAFLHHITFLLLLQQFLSHRDPSGGASRLPRRIDSIPHPWKNVHIIPHNKKIS